MASFDDLHYGIPLEVAAKFFIGLKKFGAEAEPDETGALEGQFPVPVEQVLAVLSDLVRAEFETHYAYKVYAQTLRDLSRDSIADHFEEHADDEMGHADFLLKRMSVLGGPAHVPDIPAPPPSADPCEIIRRMIRMEQEGIANWKKLLQVVGDNPMRITVEDYMVKEQEHADDLWQLLPHEVRTAVLDESVPGEALKTATRYSTSLPTGELSEAQLLEAGRRRGLLNVGAQAEKDEAFAGSRHGDVAGRLAGAALGGGTGYGIARGLGGSPAAQLAAIGGGALLGQGLGGRVGKDIGLTSDLADMKEAAARFKTAAYHSMYGPDGHYSGYSYDSYAAQMAREMSNKADVEELQGRLRMAKSPEHQEAIKRQFVEDRVASGQFGGVLGGGLLGGVALGALGKAVVPHPAGAVLGGIGGAALGGLAGYHLGGAAGKSEGRKLTNRAYAGELPAAAPEEKAAAARFKLASMKLAVGGEIMSDVPAAASEPAPISGDLPPAAGGPDPKLMEYLQQEQAGQQAQEQNMAEFYKQRFDQANQQLQAAQQAQQSTQQQLQQMQGQIDQSMQQSQQAMEQARQTQQMSLQQASAASQAATQAMQQTMSANSELLNQQQLSSNMRNAYQQLQQQLQQLSAQPPPAATTMEAGMAQPPAPGAAPSPEQGAAPPEVGAGTPEATAEQAPPGGGPPPGAQGPEAGGAPTEQAPPGLEGAAPQGEAGQMEQPKTSQVSDLEYYLMKGAQAGAIPPFSQTVRQYAPELLGAAGGALIGGIGGYVEPKHVDREALKQEIAAMEQAHQSGELGGFSGLKNLAALEAKRKLLGTYELADKHPHAVAASTALAGAGIGAGAGRSIATLLGRGA